MDPKCEATYSLSKFCISILFIGTPSLLHIDLRSSTLKLPDLHRKVRVERVRLFCLAGYILVLVIGSKGLDDVDGRGISRVPKLLLVPVNQNSPQCAHSMLWCLPT